MDVAKRLFQIRKLSRIRWLFLLALAACVADFPSGTPAHAMADLDPAWYPELTLTPESYADQACAMKPVESAKAPCAKAMAPRANEAVDCPATFVYLAIRGCCIPYHAVSSPTITDRVYFFECPK